LRIDNGRLRRILTVECKNVKSVKLQLVVLLARVQRLEIGDPVDAEHDGLAIDHEILLPVLQRALDNPRIAVGLIVPALFR
jgi:hypothetical protein